jgi:arylsulfatase A-like enzyme
LEAAPGTVVEESTARETSLSPRAVLAWALWFGLASGYLELGTLLVKRDLFHASVYYEQGKNFYWTMPISAAVVMMVPGLVLAGINWLRPATISVRSASWLLATLMLWAPLLRAPIHGAASLLLAAGTARFISRGVARHAAGFHRLARLGLCVLIAVVGTTAGVSLRRQAQAEARALALLPAPAEHAANVVLLVMDTVRAQSMGLYNYKRDTTPSLAQWAKKGVVFDGAFAPAPWTFPSHAAFMTGHWPAILSAHWNPILDPSRSTLAEFLASRGYVTGGFAANTFWCSYESGMDRGFAHYEDYPLSLRTILGCTSLGRWPLEHIWVPGGFYGVKWVRAQSRDASEINRAFLDWLDRARGKGRPFFAFINYLDAHEPFVAPPAETGQFGLHPASSRDFRMLLNYWDLNKLKLAGRDVDLARDTYDNCIAALDRQVGALLGELDRRGVLGDTVVIITSDHGEEFGEHGVFNHGFSVYRQAVHVPLLIIAPTAPAGLRVTAPVSLRDLPATIVDLAAAGANSPFPGRSLAEHWKRDSAAVDPLTTPAYSEVDIPFTIGPERGHGPPQRGFTVSLAAGHLHYLLDVNGNEELYDLSADSEELRNIRIDPRQEAELDRFRSSLALLLRDNRASAGNAANYQQQLLKWLHSAAARPPN